MVPFRTDDRTAGTLAFFSTMTVFGTPVDITLSELALEAFYPADAATAEALRRMSPAATPVIATPRMRGEAISIQ